VARSLQSSVLFPVAKRRFSDGQEVVVERSYRNRRGMWNRGRRT